MSNADTGWRRNKWGGWFNIYEDRTVGGKRIKVKKGQSLKDAMRESGKFPSVNKSNDENDIKSNREMDEISEEEKAKAKQEVLKKIEETQTNTEHEEKKDSLARYTDENGNLKPEREAIHRQIIEEYFEGKIPVQDGEEKLYYMTGGGSGTGKSNFVENKDGKYYNKNFYYDKGKNKFEGNMIKIDADDLKGRLYELGKEKNKDRHRYSASYLHEESSALSKRINEISFDLGYNTMLDSTGDGKPNKLKAKIDAAHQKGYKVIATYGTCDYQKGLDNNLERYISKASKKDPTARYVKEKEVVKLHRDVTNTLIEDAKYFDKVDLYDMQDYNNIKKIASGGNGKDLIVEKKYQKEYNNFANKGKLTDKELKKMAKDYYETATKKLDKLNLKRRG